MSEVISRFLDNACPDHHVRGGADHLRAQHTALRLLARYPTIATANFYTAVVCGDLEAVRRTLEDDPGAATRPNGVASAERSGAGGEMDLAKKDFGDKGWEPLSYLCFTRLPLPSVTNNAVAIAHLLLDSGANPNAYFMAGGSRYTPLVGVIGEGEEGRPPHQQRDALVQLLLERGANADDEQVFYNIRFGPDGAQYSEPVRSHEPLFAAARHNRGDVAALLLALGADPNVESPAGERALHGAAYHDAVDVAELLIARGADVDPIGRRYGNTPLGGAMHARSARMISLLARVSTSTWEVAYAGNVDRLRELLAERPDRARGYDGETLLMYLPVDDEPTAIEIARLLLEHGADASIRDPHGGTAADRAERNAMYDLAALLRSSATQA